MANKIGRNEPCPCGSGKKHKKCCINEPTNWGARQDEKLSEPPLYDLATIKQLNDIMKDGYRWCEKHDPIRACDVWLNLWQYMKPLIPKEIKSISELDNRVKLGEFLLNWCQDFESEYHKAGSNDNTYFQKRIDYCTEFCRLFPDTSWLTIHNMKRSIAESYFSLGLVEKGDKAFRKLVEEFPKSAWAYIGWGDMYYVWRLNEEIPKDYDKAKSIYEMALMAKEIDEPEEVVERLKDLGELRRMKREISPS